MATKKNQVAEKGQFTLDNVPDYLELVEKKIDELRKKIKGDDGDVLSDTNLEGFGDLSKIEEVDQLVRAHSSIVNREVAYKKSAKALDVKLSKYPFEINGVSASRWVAYIKRRIGEVTYQDDLDKFEQVRNKLKGYVSEEQKFASDMKDIAQILSE